jgi:hypothetical protein
MAINIRFGDYAGQDSLRSERQVTVTGDRGERRSDLQRIIDDYPAVEAEHRPLKLLNIPTGMPCSMIDSSSYHFKSLFEDIDSSTAFEVICRYKSHSDDE